MSILSCSHTDLDGISCQIVLRKAFGDITRMNISYSKIDEYLFIIESYCINSSPSKVFITDLSYTYEQLEALSKLTDNFPHINFYFIDHHPFKDDYKHLIKSNFTIVITKKASATKLTYLFCKANKYITEDSELLTYVNYVNAYDIWLNETKEFKVGFVYNELFWQYKISYFWSKFKDNYKLRQTDKDYYKDLMKKKIKLFDKLDSSGRMFKLGDKDIFAVFIDDFRSHITLDYPDYKIYVICASYGGISIRLSDSINEQEDFKDKVLDKINLLDNVSNSGGHPAAFGITLKDTSAHEQVEFIKSVIPILDKELDNIKE